jgi:hypothetical protein
MRDDPSAALPCHGHQFHMASLRKQARQDETSQWNWNEQRYYHVHIWRNYYFPIISIGMAWMKKARQDKLKHEENMNVYWLICEMQVFFL